MVVYLLAPPSQFIIYAGTLGVGRGELGSGGHLPSLSFLTQLLFSAGLTSSCLGCSFFGSSLAHATVANAARSSVAKIFMFGSL
jgi:hypothetical protein